MKKKIVKIITNSSTFFTLKLILHHLNFSDMKLLRLVCDENQKVNMATEFGLEDIAVKQ